jgi:hypothetical protein
MRHSARHSAFAAGEPEAPIVDGPIGAHDNTEESGVEVPVVATQPFGEEVSPMPQGLPADPAAEADAAPAFSLSIGRIDVEFVNPPTPPAAAPADPRTRGFADYARIRRGAPR